VTLRAVLCLIDAGTVCTVAFSDSGKWAALSRCAAVTYQGKSSIGERGKLEISGKVVAVGTVLLVVLTYLLLAGSEHWFPFTSAQSTARASSSTSGKQSPAASGPSSGASKTPPAAESPSGAYAYSTPEPGPGCDRNGATWAEENVQFSSGCEVEASVQGQYGFLNITLPAHKAFTQNNTVSITGSLGNSGDGYDSACLGLEEDGSGSGYLAAYCNDGDWYIYTTSGEVIGHQLTTGSIPMGVNGTTYQMTLTLKASALSLTFNNVSASGAFKVATLTITPFEPSQIGIGYEYGTYQVPAPATDFIYTTQ
jgi:hypothetical protein